MSVDIPCRCCGAVFHARRMDALWCKNCQVIKRRERQQHYEWNKKEPCPQCGSPMGRGAKWCRPCENKSRKERYLGANNPNWREGRTMANGYVLRRITAEKHQTGRNAYRPEHHIVWEKTHGKPLPKGWVVHHLNGVKDDNRPENLLGISRKDHHTQHRAYERRIRGLEEEIRTLQQLKLDN